MNALRFLEQVLADRACFLCGEESELPICPDCLSRFRLCDVSWTEVDLVNGKLRGFSAYWYEGTVRQAILQMKVQGEYRLAGQLASRLAACAPRLPDNTKPVFIPIPRFGPPDLRRRSDFPPSAARVLADAVQGEDGTGLLVKVRKTALQTKLSDTERRTNVAGAFQLSAPAAGMVEGRSIVIVDDVLTTGATIGAAMEAILPARPHQCLYLTLARSRATIVTGL